MKTYVTEKCTASIAKDAARRAALNRICKKCETINATEDPIDKLNLERYHANFGVYKPSSRGGTGLRIIMEESSDGDEKVVVFRGVHHVDDSDFDLFRRDINKYKTKFSISEQEDKKIKNLYNTLGDEIQNIEPSEDEQKYLRSYNNDDRPDKMFMESHHWVEEISKPWAKNYLGNFYNIISEHIEKAISHEPDQTICNEGNLKVLYRYLPKHDCIFLMAPIKDDYENALDESQLRNKYQDILGEDDVDLNRIIQCSKRAYPEIIICDDNIWLKVQQDNESNLALSPEEEEILRSVTTFSENKTTRYPLFINGRAGSGKSTILQYLYSDYLKIHIDQLDQEIGKNDEIYPPLYLTYSGPLLNKAKTLIKNILTLRADNAIDDEFQLEPEQLSKITDDSCWTFRNFLRKQLPDEDKNRFSYPEYMYFNKFRGIWEQQRIGNNTKLAWHIIRTFIKGYMTEDMKPERYEKLPKKIKTVSQDDFETVYQLWSNRNNWWEDEYWDDQDLVRAVLQLDTNKLSIYPAVFCDEAQDFTKIELELITKLSLFPQRKLRLYEIRDIPFVFAGDPLQTLNPTGFSWEAMKAGFYDNIVKSLDVNGQAGLKFNYQELLFNYRSSEAIVKLSNLIQLLRGCILNRRGLNPQKSWAQEQGAVVCYFDQENEQCKKEIREQPELVIIIPSQENNEDEYIRQDNFLNTLENPNVLSAIQSKGLEYNRVLLYGFGQAVINRIPNILKYIEGDEPIDDDNKDKIALDYFFNELYVALTRAKKRLFIVDSQQAITNLWKLSRADLIQRYGCDWQEEDLGLVVEGNEQNWHDDHNDPAQLAENFEKQGKELRDSYLMDLAKKNYKRANKPEESKYCEALYYEYKENLEQAGKIFLAISKPEDACRCYWAVQKYDEVTKLITKFPNMANDPRYLATKLQSKIKITAQEVGNLLDALEDTSPPLFPDSPKEVETWKSFFKSFIKKLVNAIKERKVKGWKKLVDQFVYALNRLEISETDYLYDMAELHYLIGDEDVAEEFWDRLKQKPEKVPDWVKQMKVKKQKYPDNIKYLYELGEYYQIIKESKNNKQKNLKITDEQITNIWDSAIKIADNKFIQSLLLNNKNIDQIIQLLEKYSDFPTTLHNDLLIAINLCLCSKRIDEAISFADKRISNNQDLDKQIEELNILEDKYVRYAALIHVLARDKALDFQDQGLRTSLSEFKSYLIYKKDKKNKQHVLKMHQLVDNKVVGIMFEHIGYYADTVEYYKQWYQGNIKQQLNPSKEQREFAQQRYLHVVKENKKMTDTEVRDKAKEWGVSIENLLPYPELEPLSKVSISSPKDESIEVIGQSDPKNKEKSQSLTVSSKGEITINDLTIKFEVLRLKQRIILTDKDENQVTCQLDGITSNDISVEKKPDQNIWVIFDWNTHCEIETNNNEIYVRLRSDDGSLIYGFLLEKPHK